MLNNISYKTSKVIKKHDYSLGFIFTFLLLLGSVYCSGVYNRAIEPTETKQEITYVVNEDLIFNKIKEVVAFKEQSYKVEESIYNVKVEPKIEVAEVKHITYTPTTIHKTVSSKKHTKVYVLAKIHKHKYQNKTQLAKISNNKHKTQLAKHKHSSKIQLANKSKFKESSSYYNVKIKPYKEYISAPLPITYTT
jgi:hypothetical protein